MATVTADVPDLVPSQGHEAVYVRRFNRPTAVSDSTAITLRVGAFAGQLERLTINDTPIETGNTQPTTIDLTGRLEPHNTIAITLTSTDTCDSPHLSGEVTLQIDDAEA